MRRLSAFLMIAALVAVLVPSVALAGKTVPSITNIDVIPVQPVGDSCQVQVNVYFVGRAFEVQIEQISNGSGVGALSVRADNKSGSVLGTQFAAPLLGSTVYTWQAVLLDRKGNVIGLPRSTDAEEFTGMGVCPENGTAIATFPWS